ncbi:hypothetical protein HAX54_032159, partial [Datura stramonium]|nr:hypothetical protein [Datura stramonium]
MAKNLSKGVRCSKKRLKNSSRSSSLDEISNSSYEDFTESSSSLIKKPSPSYAKKGKLISS